MSFNLARAKVAVLSKHGYLADSISLALEERTGCKTKAITSLDLGALDGFDTVLIEVSPSLESALAWASRIAARYPDAKVILLGLEECEENVVKLAEAGASGYVGPASSLEELVTILRSIYRGEFTCPPHITFALFSHLAHLASGSAPVALRTPVLTIRERKVVELLSHNLTNKEIGERLCISEYTAKNHVQRILKKLGLHDRSLAFRSPFSRCVGTPKHTLAGDVPG
jgi:DNA-binding NarL/FixJ family response regulator